MRYVAGKPHRGSVGHQLTTIWYAKLFSELFGFTYAHAPFIDNPTSRWSMAASWNDFFGLGHNELAVDLLHKSCGSLTHSFGPYDRPGWDFRYAMLARLADAVPDNYVLQFEDLGHIHADSIREWEASGYAMGGTLRRICGWFQAQLQKSARYQATPIYQHPENVVRLSVYWRRPLPDEQFDYHDITQQQLEQAIAKIHTIVKPKPLSVVVFTQAASARKLEIAAEFSDLVVCREPSAVVAMAYKSLIEADVAISTVGNSASLIGIYRAFRKPTFGVPGWGIDSWPLTSFVPERFVFDQGELVTCDNL